jgi:integrase
VTALSQKQLDAFSSYLAEYALDPDTIDKYVGHVRRCYAGKGPIAQLKSDLAPKTKRLVRAAIRHWANHTEDDELRKAVSKLRLPAPRRKTAKAPLDKLDLLELRTAIAKRYRGPLLAVLRLMSDRGFRDGDVLRLERSHIAKALKSGRLTYEAKGRRWLEFTVIKTFRPWLELLVAETGWETVAELISPKSGSEDAQHKSASRRVQRSLKRAAEDLGLEGVHPHRLRRTYCVEYLKAHKGDPEALMKLTQHMQWANATTALEYVDHVRGIELDRVAETIFDEE